jgi:cytoplasmic FMR1 interacting protein
MSMPWILTSHILDTKDQSLMEFVFYPLDLYNDAAMNALTVFRKRHLYDEVEAEVNLCFDQFVYLLSEQIFRAYKQTAAGILLDKKFRDEFNKIQAQSISLNQNTTTNGLNGGSTTTTTTTSTDADTNNRSKTTLNGNKDSNHHHHQNGGHPADAKSIGNHYIKIPNTSRYATLMKQRHIQLLGRSINLSRLISQRITNMLIKSLRNCIEKFESGDLTGIIELDTLIQINKLTHKLLSAHLVLQDFDSLFKEADANITSSYGRITIHILYEINSDILINYCYNQSTMRFVPTKMRLVKSRKRADDCVSFSPQDLWGSKAIQTAFQQINSLYSQFIGHQHMKCLTKYLGYQGIALIMSEFLKFIEMSIQTNLAEYVRILYMKLKKNINIPRYEYGSSAIMTFYYESLAQVIGYSELRTNVFHQFAQVGNALIFSLLLEQTLSLDEVNDLVHASIYLNWLPKPFCKENENIEVKMKKIEQKFASLQVVKIIEKLGNEKQINLIHESELLTRERLCCGLSIFEFMLNKVKGFLDADPLWSDFNQQAPINDVMNVEENVEFHRVWSAMQFIYCLPRAGNAYLVE